MKLPLATSRLGTAVGESISSSARIAVVAMVLLAGCKKDGPTAPSSPAQIEKGAGDGQIALAGSSVATPPMVIVSDADGKRRLGVGVTFAVISGGGTITGATAFTDGSGRATVGSWTLGTSKGVNSLSATVGGLLPVSFTATGVAGPAASLVKFAGDTQRAPIGTALPIRPAVRVADAHGNPVAGAAVTFSAALGSGTITGAIATTDSSGIATIGSWTLGTTAGINTLTATAGGLPAVAFGATGTGGTPTTITQAGGDGQSRTAGTAVLVAPSVIVRDVNANPVQGATVTFAVASGGGSITGAIATTNAQGIATVGSWTLGPTAGPNSLTATVASLAPVTFTANGVAGAATKLAFKVQPSTATAGVSINPAIEVEVQDANGNRINPSSGSITIAMGSNPGSSTLGGVKTTTHSSGVATFNTLTLDKSGTGYTLVATSTGLTSATSVPFNVIAGAPATITKSAGDAQTANAGQAVAISPSVTIRDEFGNPTAGIAVTFAVASGGGSVTGATQTTNALGVTTVGSWILGPIPGTNTLTATVTGLTAVTFTATGQLGPAAKLAFKVQPTNVIAGVSIAPPVEVEVQDAAGNRVTGASGSVSIAIGANPGGAALGGVTSQSPATGVATFNNLTLDKSGTGYTLVASSSGLTSATSAGFNVTAAAATTMTKTAGDNQSAPTGQAVAVAPSVTVRDAFGNPTSGVTVTFAVASGGGGVTGGTQTTNSGGVATVGSWTMGPTAGSNTLTASAAGLTSVTFSATGTTLAGSGTWQTKTSMTFARSAPSAEVINGILYVAGGHSGTSDTPTLQAYNATSNSWTALAAMPAGRYSGSGAGVIAGELYVTGGWTTSPGLPNSSVFVYTPGTNTWRSVASMPVLSGCGSSGVIAGKLYVTTACDGFSGYRNFLHVYDPATNVWTQRASSPNVHQAPASGVIGGKLYVAGGGDAAGTPRGTLDVYDPSTNVWTTLTAMSTVRAGAVGAVVNGRLYVIGGWNGTQNVASVEVYDPVTNAWTTLASMPAARQNMAGGVIANVVYVVGGSGVTSPLATVESFTP